MSSKIFKLVFLMLVLGTTPQVYSQTINQTDLLSPVLPSDDLPFQVTIEQLDFSLPNGVHSYASTIYKDKWLILAGRTNGMHTFNNNNNNFPPLKQNTTVYVVDIKEQTVYSRSLNDPATNLSQDQIDFLSVTSPQFYKHHDTLYISGGYGVNTGTGLFSTKPCLTAINIPGFISWVMNEENSLDQYVRQIFDPFFQVTGGLMVRSNKDTSLLIFGQNFAGYYVPSSNGQYTEQVRRFHLSEELNELHFKEKSYDEPNPNYRRRDLNIVPIVQGAGGFYEFSYCALSGVFTEAGGVWTIPVMIKSNGSSSMKDPYDPHAFKQAMNNYACANVGLFSEKHREMYTILFGGISYGFFSGGVFTTDPEIPFINQVTTVKLDRHGNFTQYLMNGEYPVIPSTGSNPGNPLLFGAGATFFKSGNVHTFENNVIKLDRIGKKPVVIGYIVGGIQSTLPNTNVASDSAASAYIFEVTLTKNH